MTISKERLNEIALDVGVEADNHAEEIWKNQNGIWRNWDAFRDQYFALALIRRVEAEGDTREFYCNNGDIDRVTTLPLVSEE